MLKSLQFKATSTVQELLCRLGYTVVPLPLGKYLKQQKVDLVVDCGAANGGYGMLLRRSGYRGLIVSFEPYPYSAEELKSVALKDENWKVIEKAVGTSCGVSKFFVTTNGDSSSLSELQPKTTEISPEISLKCVIDVITTRLDSEIGGLVKKASSPMLKLDIQGREMDAIRSAGALLSNFVLIQAEVSLQSLYKDCPLIEDVISEMRALGFVPIWFQHGYKDSRKQQLMQVDAFFVNSRNAT